MQLRGGLGNQLFQYATGRALAIRSQTELSLDLGQLQTERYRPFRLQAFDLAARPASTNEVPFEFRRSHRPRVIHGGLRRIRRVLPWNGRTRVRVIREDGLAPGDYLANAKGDVYLVGFWQSPRYFEDEEDVIRAEAALSPERVGVSLELAGEVRRQGTVSVHVRRGDYVGNPFFSPCSATYYHRALEVLASRMELTTAYVFSDDIAWAEVELQLAVPTVFVGKPDSSVMGDFFLMSQCHHHVIANSSFSWWAAWLGRRPQGQVVSPDRWFNDPARDTRDLRPADWLVV